MKPEAVILTVLMLTNAIAFFSLKKRMTLVSFFKTFLERSEDQREDIKLWTFQISFLLLVLVSVGMNVAN